MATNDDRTGVTGARDPPSRKIGEGALSAAFRQGVKELGEGLKAFPESISVQEPGALFSPTQGEIADANRGGTLWDRVNEIRERHDAARDRNEPERAMDRE